MTATEAFNVANGAISKYVILAGTASLNKRTDGTVQINGDSSDLAYSGGTFNDDPDGQLIYGGGRGAVTTTTLTYLYWDPSSTSATWDTGTTTMNWRSTETSGPANAYWQNGDVAVFDTAFANGVTDVDVAAAVSPSEIKIDDQGFDIESNGGGYISIPDSQSLVVNVASGVTATLGCLLDADGTDGTGSVTKEGAGTLLLGAGGTTDMYYGGTFIDAGTLRLGSGGALGWLDTTWSSVAGYWSDSVDVTVDGTGKLDLNRQSIAVSSLNSSYYSGSGPDGTVTRRQRQRRHRYDSALGAGWRNAGRFRRHDRKRR